MITFETNQDEDAVLTKLQRKAENGHADAQLLLGRKYFFGEGVEKDYKKSVQWLVKAFRQGHESALIELHGVLRYCPDVLNEYLDLEAREKALAA